MSTSSLTPAPQPPTTLEAARYIIDRERRQANQIIAAMQDELDTLKLWAKDPGGLRAHNLTPIEQLVRNAQRYLNRAEALEELLPRS